MKLIFFIFAFLFSSLSHGAENLLFLSDGQVRNLSEDYSPDYFDQQIEGEEEIESEFTQSFSWHSYQPSVLTLEEARATFRSMNRRSREGSQCYNRAHVWAYEAYRNRSLMSMKVFMFFTLKYIREYRYRWWFHAAPFVYVWDGSSTREVVLDRTFTDGPMGIHAWSERFVRPKTRCVTVDKYSDYQKLQNKVYCVFMKVPMYFWQPRDLEILEKRGRAKQMFFRKDIKRSYRNAF